MKRVFLLQTIPSQRYAAPGFLQALALLMLLTGLAPIGVRAQGALTSGGNHSGTITASTTSNSWTFTASAGDSVALRLGSTGFSGKLDLYGPGSTLLRTAGGNSTDWPINYTATNAGTFTVVVSSYYAGGTGTYVLRFLQIPGVFTVPASDEGGAMTNGGNYAGTITVGDFDPWTFTASPGNSIVLRLGSTGFQGNLVLYGPNGALLKTVGGNSADWTLEYTPTNSGTFTVVVSTYYQADTGNYVLHFLQVPGPFIVPASDEGGSLTNGGNHTGTLTIGDFDPWTFSANAGESIALRLGSTGFQGDLTLYGPDGALLKEAGGNSPDWSINYTPTNSGTFTVVVSGYYQGSTGSYTLSYLKVPGSLIVPTGDEGGAMTNGGNYAGNLTLGDLDPWTFTANAGENIVLRLGSTGFQGNLVLYGPDGALLKTAGGNINDWTINFMATNSGTFTVVVSGYYQGSTGNYTLSYLKVPGSLIVPTGDEGGAMTNGGNYAGNLTLGDLDPWTFTANAGENIVLRLGSTGFQGNLVLYGPDGAVLKTAGGNINDWAISYMATNSGTFTVVVSGYYQGSTGNYTLSYVKVPGPLIVPTGDEGGAMINGGNYAGTLTLGDLDPWTFTASTGENIVLRLGSTGFQGNLVLYGPDGALLKTAGGNINDWAISYTATNTGIFTAVVSGYYQGSVGSYVLHYIKTPGVFIVPAGDDGGSMNGADSYVGSLDLGDLDLWAFTACKGDPITLRLNSTNFQGNMNLYGPDGALLKTVGGNLNVWTLTYATTNWGRFAVLVSSYYQADVGTYRLTASGLSDELRICAPNIYGTNLFVSGVGGPTGSTFILLQSTNVEAPLSSWTPFWTNQFDRYGTFGRTNAYNPNERRKFFRYRVP